MQKNNDARCTSKYTLQILHFVKESRRLTIGRDFLSSDPQRWKLNLVKIYLGLIRRRKALSSSTRIGTLSSSSCPRLLHSALPPLPNSEAPMMYSRRFIKINWKHGYILWRRDKCKWSGCESASVSFPARTASMQPQFLLLSIPAASCYNSCNLYFIPDRHYHNHRRL